MLVVPGKEMATENLKQVVSTFYPDCLTVNKHADVDIHTVEPNQIKQVHHLEDWATAIRQMKG